MFASSSLGEEGGERVVSSCLVGRHGAIRLNSMFKAVEFPASITNLNQKKILKVIFKRIKKLKILLGLRLGQRGLTNIHAFSQVFFKKNFLEGGGSF